MDPLRPIELQKIKCVSLKERDSKVKLEDFARPWTPGGSMAQWLESLPTILAGQDLREIVGRIARSVTEGRSVILGMGAHPVKVGLSPVIIDLMERGVITALAMNGACIIHDAEIAMVGHTSEDVEARIGGGRFGMAEETGRILNQAIVEGAHRGMGLGEAVGAKLAQEGFPHNGMSILARAHALGLPVTVHVAVGTDTIHFHPDADGAAIGKTSHLDFRLFASLVSGLEEGVFINLGSAVIIPEVFLKAVTLVRNLGHPLRNFTTVNMDFIRHYRPMTNVVHRPTMEGGGGYALVGHHELMFPLLAGAVIERIEEEGKDKEN